VELSRYQIEPLSTKQRGVRCACAIAEEIRPLGIDVRAGFHTGECAMISDDVGGIAVHIGARVAALAGAARC
jgi:class 3 adenylate cyclase